MTQRTRISAFVLCLGAFMGGLDLFIVNVAFPDLARDFAGTDLSTLSWVLNAYTIVFAALLVPAGRWADAFGRKRIFLSGLALFVVASAASAAAPSIGALIAFRVVQAAGAALLLPASLALLLPMFPPEKRSIAVAIWAASSAVAAAAGPPIGGLLVELSWHWVFIVNVPVGLVALVLGTRVLREAHDPSTLRPDELGAGLLAVGVGALVAGIVQGPEWGWTDGRILALFAAAALLLAIVAARCVRHPSPVVEPALLQVRAFRVAAGAATVFFAGFGAMLLTSVLALTGPWHESVLTAGLMIAPGPATAAVFSVPGARLAQRIGMSAVGVLGTALFVAAGIWWLTQLSTELDYAGAFLPGMIVGGAGVGLVIPTLTAAAAAALPPARFATGTAVVTMARQLGLAIGVAVLVALLGTPSSIADFEAAWAFVAATGAVSGLAFAALGPIAPVPATATA